MNTEKMIYLSKIPLLTKEKIHKWSISIMKRAQFNPNFYLRWIQYQNKYLLNFYLNYNDERDILNEVKFVKNYLLLKEGKELYNKVRSVQSSKSYNLFLERVKSYFK